MLDRSTLQPVATWGGPANTASMTTLAQQVSGYDDAQLAIITTWADPGWAAIGHPGVGLTARGEGPGEIGSAQFPLFYAPDPLIDGQMTWVGVPGSPAGSAWQTFGVPGGAGVSTLDGFLAPDSNDNYVYLAGRPTTFDLGPDSAGSTSASLQIGAATYRASLPAGQGGFTVAYLDARSLAPTAQGQQTYATTNGDGTPNLSEMTRMTTDLGTAQSNRSPMIVAIRSIGNVPLAPIGLQPPSYSGPFDSAYADALDALSTAVALSGGSAQTFIAMATAPLTGASAVNSYSLLGSNGQPSPLVPQLGNQGQGAEVGSGRSPAPASTELSGQLMRDHWQRYAPAGGVAADSGATLLETALAEPSSWPFTSTSAGNAAVACIGVNVADLGADPRAAYWTQPYSGSDWLTIQSQVSALRPSACPSVAVALFRQVRAQIATEIGWVVNVDSYIDSLVTPFTSDGLSSFADLASITQDVVSAVKPPPRATARFSILGLFIDIADLAGGFDVPAADAISASWALTGLLTPGAGGDPSVDLTDEVEDTAANIGQDLATELQTISGNYGNLVNVIVADYAKLRTVGTLGGCVSGPGCTPAWRFTRRQQDAASRMFEVSARRQIWGGILPAAYPYVLQTSSNTNAYNGTFQGPQEQISGIGCDFAQPFPVATPVFLRYGIRQVGNTPFMVLSQTDFQGASSPATNFPPPRSNVVRDLTTLFAPLDPAGDPSRGGLGVDQYDFMVTNWTWTDDTTRAPTPALKQWRGCGG
ncbi:hypothetical protein VSS74_12305 [Conexibacter stalactiti]|uniref:Uncharacterized protein n=1 Tax=Conexibacter stalactiti TaxID=1940611 RepID=A0ABU4HPF3_9ACTN|nr:hypothetical protein [Conexibacter stalactiti]MDW5595125.1 hypothetical protein [Conexibacter stalactiti]MEC5035767.1 hypothetical protein [Conexibacter stalactiti]